MLERAVTEPLQNIYSNMSIPSFQRPLALGILSDQLSHFQYVLSNKPFRGDYSRQSAKEFELHSCQLKVVNYFYNLFQRS